MHAVDALIAVAKEEKNIDGACANQESNQGLNLGKVGFYH